MALHIGFEYPLAFLALAGLICFWHCKREPLKIYFSRTDLLPSFQLRQFPFGALLFTLLVLALAGPFTYENLLKNPKKGRDLILALDSSGSMEFEMQEKSKFGTLIEVAKSFLHNRFDDNIGLVVFGSFAYTASPITYDLKALEFILDYLEVGLAGNSTAIGDAIWQALETLHEGEAKEKVVILVTDGHHNAGSHSPKQAVDRAKKEGVKIYTIGISKESDEKLLQTIAKETGAKSFIVNSEEELLKVFEEIDTLEPSPIRSGIYENKKMLFWIPLSLAAALILWRIARRA